ncbi:Homeobox protein [Yarrowia sp. C11]|nr:Homeobox protein [Yarrowia sp. C11]KAG5370581.1 Homeobox protein [Yarrowia sp. E02]
MDLAKITDGFVKQEPASSLSSASSTTNTGPTPDLSPVTPSKECEKRPREDDAEDAHDKSVAMATTHSNHSNHSSGSLMSTPEPKSSSPPGLSHFAHLMQKSDTMYRQNLNSDQYIFSDEEKENHKPAKAHMAVPHTPSSLPPQQPQYAFISHSITSYPSNEPQIDNARLARRKRRRTSPTELALLEQEFARNQKPPKHIRVDIARRVDMTEKAVQVWFQNKRQSVRKSMNKSMTDDTSFADSSFAETTFDETDGNSTFLSNSSALNSNTHLHNKSITSSVTDTKSPLAQSTTAASVAQANSNSTSNNNAVSTTAATNDSEIASVAPKSTGSSFSVFEDAPETPAKKKPTAPRLSMRGGKATVIYAGKPKGAQLSSARRLGVPATPSSPGANGLGLGGSPLATSSPMAQRTASQLNQASASSPLSALKSKSFGTAEESLAATLKKRLPSMHYDLPVTNKTSSVRHGVASPVVDAGSREAECISNLLSLRNGGRW